MAEGDLRARFEAARWTTSPPNAQPWTFIVARRDDAQAHGRPAGVLNNRNRRRAPAVPALASAWRACGMGETENAYTLADHRQRLAPRRRHRTRVHQTLV